jgi:hypothetical protein
MWSRNDDIIERLSSDMQERYEFAFAWESVCSLYLGLPGLRGFWPMSSINTTGAVDLSGQVRNLTRNGGHFGHDVLIPYYDAVDPDWLSRGDEPGLDILGTEAYVEAASQGITMGAWIMFDDPAPANTDMIISKGLMTAANNTSYGLYRRSAAAGGVLRATFSNSVVFEHVDSLAEVDDDVWLFTAAKWGPAGSANESACFLNNVKATSGATALASLRNSARTFQIMGRDDGAGGSLENTSGRVSLAFLCAEALHDGAIIALYERSRALFGV